MTKLQFRVLYREFLFRMVDLELIAPQGDMSKLLGQFASLLIFFSMLISFSALGFASSPLPRADLLISAWGIEHFLISTTMLVVGLFAVLSWDSTLPDRRDVLVLTPLPIRARTLFLAKVAASASALGLTVGAINACTGLAFPLALAPDSTSALDLILSPARYRLLAAYWFTVLAAGAFIYCTVLGLQGVAAQLLPRRHFLRLSALLQMAAFCLFVSVYFLEPSLANPKALSAPDNQWLLGWLPSYWFLGLFQQLNGSMHPVLEPLVRRAWTGLATAGLGTALAYALSYWRTLRKIVEEPDILPGARGWRRLPNFGTPLQTAILQFSVRTLLRSRQHRVMLAFYLGVGFAIVILFLRAAVVQGEQLTEQANIRLLFSSFLLMFVWVVGTRVVFSMPLELRANWVFRLTEVREAPEYLAAIRLPLFVLAVMPVWLAAAGIFLLIWPWRPAVGHLAVLGLWGMSVAYLSLHSYQKIPFTCSYLPGKSYLHMAFLVAGALVLLLQEGVRYERQALSNARVSVQMLLALSVVTVLLRWRTVAHANSGEAFVQFEEEAPPAILELGLHRDGILPG